VTDSRFVIGMLGRIVGLSVEQREEPGGAAVSCRSRSVLVEAVLADTPRPGRTSVAPRGVAAAARRTPSQSLGRAQALDVIARDRACRTTDAHLTEFDDYSPPPESISNSTCSAFQNERHVCYEYP
jgi:hypothetical protein